MKKIFELPIFLILNFIYVNSPVRHRDIAKQIKSRGTLSASLNSLLEEELIDRYVNTKTKPIQTYYLITKKGEAIVEKIQEIREILGIQDKLSISKSSPKITQHLKTHQKNFRPSKP